MNIFEKLNTDADSCIAMAKNKEAEGDFVFAIDYYFKARELSPKPLHHTYYFATLQISLLFYDLNLFEESNKYLYELCSLDCETEEVLTTIIKNHISLGNTTQAMNMFFYAPNIGKAVDKLDLMEIISEEEGEIESKKGIHVLEYDDNSYVVLFARKMIEAGDAELAKKIIKSVPKERQNHIDILKVKTDIAHLEDDPYRAERYCDAILEQDHNNIFALTNKMLCLNGLQRYKELNVLIDKIDNMKITRFYEKFRVFSCAYKIGANKLARKYSLLCLEESEYDKMFLLIYAISSANLGFFNEAKKSIKLLTTFYPNDIVVRYKAREIANLKDKKADMPLLLCLTDEQEKEQCEILEKHSRLNPPELQQAIEKNAKLKEAILWALDSEIYSIMFNVVEMLLPIEECFGYIQEKLVDQTLPIPIKKLIYAKVLMYGRKDCVCVTNDAEFYRLNYPDMLYKKLSKAFKEAYILLYCASIFDCEEDVSFTRVFNKMRKALDCSDIKEEDYDGGAIAAVVACKAKIGEIYEKKSHAAGIFGCSEAAFEEYEAVLNQFSKKKK